MSETRLPPYNRDAEQSVLGSMLRDNSVINDVRAILAEPTDFYTDAHQKIFQGIIALQDQCSPVDLVTLAEWLNTQNFIQNIGGHAYLAELWDAAPTAANAEYYAKIMREHSRVRRIIRALSSLLKDAYDRTGDADELQSRFEKTAISLGQQGAAAEERPLRHFLKLALEQYDTGGPKGISYGLADLDRLTGGMRSGELIVVAGRPGGGKTAFSLAIVRHVAMKLGVPVFFASLEQRGVELAGRLICMSGRANSLRFRQGKLDEMELQRAEDAVKRLANLKIFINDSTFNLNQIVAKARRLRLREQIGFIVVDYLQLIEAENRKDQRYVQIGEISRRLKLLAKELDIPVMALAQLNRESESRSNGEPMLSDLREGGGQEQDADLVALLYPDPGRDDKSPVQTVLCKIAKHRNGMVGTVKLAFEKQYILIENADIDGYPSGD